VILSHGSSGEQSSSDAGEDLLAAVDVMGRPRSRQTRLSEEWSYLIRRTISGLHARLAPQVPQRR
jgi:hypothetical protein